MKKTGISHKGALLTAEPNGGAAIPRFADVFEQLWGCPHFVNHVCDGLAALRHEICCGMPECSGGCQPLLLYGQATQIGQDGVSTGGGASMEPLG